jgi:hypothetical protein
VARGAAAGGGDRGDGILNDSIRACLAQRTDLRYIDIVSPMLDQGRPRDMGADCAFGTIARQRGPGTRLRGPPLKLTRVPDRG